MRDQKGDSIYTRLGDGCKDNEKSLKCHTCSAQIVYKSKQTNQVLQSFTLAVLSKMARMMPSHGHSQDPALDLNLDFEAVPPIGISSL